MEGDDHDLRRVLSIRASIFKRNSAVNGGAIHLGDADQNNVVLQGQAVTFAQNDAAQDGGAIQGTSATVEITRGVFVENHAGNAGGAVSLRELTLRGAVLVNSLLIRNSAGTGAAFHGSDAFIVYSTIAENNGEAISVAIASQELGRGITFSNTVVSNNSVGNCGPAPPNFDYVNGGHNLQFPTGNCGSSIPVADPILDSMYVPVPGSPALGQGDASFCASSPVNSIDVYGQRRPQGPGCSIGAVEGDIERLINRRIPRPGK